jgi:hypothetical protein
VKVSALKREFQSVLEIAESTAPSKEGKFLRVFANELQSYTADFIGEECDEVFQIDHVTLHPDYQKQVLSFKSKRHLAPMWKDDYGKRC